MKTPLSSRPTAAPSTDETGIIIDHLIYASYRANRLRSPDISAQRWSAIYADIEALEARFQHECTANPGLPLLAAA